MRILFIAIFGLLPLWAAIGLVIFAALTMPQEHAAMAMWAFVVAIPACAVTLAISGVSLAIHENTSGDINRKRKFSYGFFAACVIGLAVAAQYSWMKKQDAEQRRKHEIARILPFVATHPAVVAAAGEPVKTSISTTTFSHDDPMPVQYDVYAKGSTHTVFAIVHADRSTKPTTFILDCTTPLSIGQREALKGACAQ